MDAEIRDLLEDARGELAETNAWLDVSVGNDTLEAQWRANVALLARIDAKLSEPQPTHSTVTPLGRAAIRAEAWLEAEDKLVALCWDRSDQAKPTPWRKLIWQYRDWLQAKAHAAGAGAAG